MPIGHASICGAPRVTCCLAPFLTEETRWDIWWTAATDGAADIINTGVTPCLVVVSGTDVAPPICNLRDLPNCCVARALTGLAPPALRVRPDGMTGDPNKPGPCIVVTVPIDDLTLTDYFTPVVEFWPVTATGIEGDGSFHKITVEVDHAACTFTVYGADLSNAVIVVVAVPR